MRKRLTLGIRGYTMGILFNERRIGMKLKMMFRILFTPDCWIRPYAIDKEWDKWLSSALSSPNVEILQVNEYQVKINGKRVWRANWPYAYGSPIYRSPLPMNKLPSRSTAFLLNDLVGHKGATL